MTLTKFSFSLSNCEIHGLCRLILACLSVLLSQTATADKAMKIPTEKYADKSAFISGVATR